MDSPLLEKISFIELAKRVLEKERRPLTVPEIWQSAQQNGIAALLNSTGKTPGASLGARLYTEVQKPSSLLVKIGSGPARFQLKSLVSATTGTNPPVITPTPVLKSAYKERDLHPLLVWFAEWQFGAHCRTIYHEKSQKKGEKQNQWIHPDIVGFSLTTKDWTHEVVQLAQNTGTLAARLFSFEVKIQLDFLSLREFFFQAVSNSSWAHEGFLVAVDIDDDPDFRAELTRLSQSFGIGVIQLNIDDPEDCKVLFAPRRRADIDWNTVDRVATVNDDFREFVNSVAKSVKINQPTVDGFDRSLTDAEINIQLRKMRGVDGKG